MTFGIGRDGIGFIIELVRGGEKCLGTVLQRLNDFAFVWIFPFRRATIAVRHDQRSVCLSERLTGLSVKSGAGA